ncbi:hypothetical protein PoB_003581900 [Plakobranchus ocellatus]|uniref:Uncharacterized protein n=1 Tax=Plakobranchus ocellatus TaxID=259542 RepID=A0AAV4AT62_9GAST|nr:hypothetical protein PoB_003581900 [Plakobranchus ocellatus]
MHLCEGWSDVGSPCKKITSGIWLRSQGSYCSGTGLIDYLTNRQCLVGGVLLFGESCKNLFSALAESFLFDELQPYINVDPYLQSQHTPLLFSHVRLDLPASVAQGRMSDGTFVHHGQLTIFYCPKCKKFRHKANDM